MLWLARGPSEPETIDATERAASLAEKSGNLAQLIKSMITRGNTALDSGDLAAAGTLADQALELAFREGSPANLGGAHALQMTARYYLGDLASAEKHFTAGLAFFDDLGFRQAPGAPVGRFGFPSLIAWMLGRTNVARERMARAMAAAIGNNPFDVAHSGYWAVRLHVYLREYEKAEALAARALELSEKHHLKLVAALSRVGLGEARAQLGRATEGIGLISQGIAGLLEIGSRLGASRLMAGLAEAQEREGAIVDALATVEQALQANPDELAYRPETLRLLGELRFKQGQTELAEADFREAIALAQRMGGKAWELRATMSLARLLAKQGRRDEARTMLADIYGWFTEGFDTADLKDAKALLDELSG
jgi:tetratricopeptide (TPR) repeat protein